MQLFITLVYWPQQHTITFTAVARPPTHASLFHVIYVFIDVPPVEQSC